MIHGAARFCLDVAVGVGPHRGLTSGAHHGGRVIHLINGRGAVLLEVVAADAGRGLACRGKPAERVADEEWAGRGEGGTELLRYKIGWLAKVISGAANTGLTKSEAGRYSKVAINLQSRRRARWRSSKRCCSRAR